MSMTISFIIWLLIGIATAYVAKQRGRDPFLWFALGMFLGLLGLVFLMILPSKVIDEGGESAKSTQALVISSPVPEIANVSPVHDYLIKDWYCLDQNRQQLGPMRFAELQTLWNGAKINELSYIWCEGMDNWKKISELSIVLEELRNPKAES